MKSILLIAVLLATSFVNAGQESHGGNIVTCLNKETVTLDYFNAALPTVGGPAEIVELKDWTEDEVVDFIRSRLKNSLFLELFDDAMEKFGPMSDWPLADLKDVNDGGEPYFLPQGCKRATAAIRQKNTIYVDPNLNSQLSRSQRGLLYVHEILYYLSNQDSSTPVREMLRIFLKKNLLQKDLIKAVQYVGAYYDYQYITDQFTYQLENSSFPKQFLVINGLFDKGETKNVTFSTDPMKRLIYSNSATLDCRKLDVCEIELYIYNNSSEPELRTCKIKLPTLKTLELNCSSQWGTITFSRLK